MSVAQDDHMVLATIPDAGCIQCVRLYESEKLARGGSKERAHDENGRFTSIAQNDPLRAKPLSTCERIATQNGVGAATVKRAEKYAKGVDAAEDAVPGAREEILTVRIGSP